MQIFSSHANGAAVGMGGATFMGTKTSAAPESIF
jgi:hypothetical protein